jgi:ubiquinone/menaquinone biosynthesis C-methylase UbiE
VTRKNTLLDQCRKPTGWRGRFILWKMNREHSNLTDWGLSHVSIGTCDTILDIGCGGGRTVSKLAARATQGRVYGIDYSPDSIATSIKKNAQGIVAGRVSIQQGSVSKLPFPDGTFDLITAVETHFFWPDLPSDMREVFRVLKPGGHFHCDRRGLQRRE